MRYRNSTRRWEEQNSIGQRKTKTMIQANQLRIGNWVYRCFYPNDLFQIRSISEDRVHSINTVEVDTNSNTIYSSDCSLSDLNPIPLTEEWLLKFGFIKDEDELFNITTFGVEGFSINTYTNWHNEEPEVPHYWLRHYQSGTTPKLHFVHQLQNLYFALTGLELFLQQEQQS